MAWRPSIRRAVWLSPAVSSLVTSMEKTGVSKARLENLRDRKAKKPGWWQETG